MGFKIVYVPSHCAPTEAPGAGFNITPSMNQFVIQWQREKRDRELNASYLV
jgi:hypothetical protein